MSFFSRSSPIGNEIISATEDGMLEDVAKNLEIVDMMAQAETGPQDAARAIQKRLNTKSKTAEALAINLLEMLVKNGGHRFHVQLAKRDFMRAFYKLVSSKGTAYYKDKLLEQLQMWADAFGRANPEFAAIYETYDELVRDGVEFPDTDLDSLAPIHTPKQSHPVTTKTKTEIANDMELAKTLQEEENSLAQRPKYTSLTGRVTVTSEEKLKLQADLLRVHDSIEFVSDSVKAVESGKSGAAFASEEYEALCSMQQRLVELLEHVLNEDLITKLLVVNDRANTVLNTCEEMLKAREPSPKPTETQSLVNLMDDLSVGRHSVFMEGAPQANPFVADPKANTTMTELPGWPTDHADADTMYSNQNSANDQAGSLAGQMNYNTTGDVLGMKADPPYPAPSAQIDNAQGLSNDDFDSFLSSINPTAPSGAVTGMKTAEQEARERAVDDLFNL